MNQMSEECLILYHTDLIHGEPIQVPMKIIEHNLWMTMLCMELSHISRHIFESMTLFGQIWYIVEGKPVNIFLAAVCKEAKKQQKFLQKQLKVLPCSNGWMKCHDFS